MCLKRVPERLSLHRLSLLTRLALFITLAMAVILFTVSGLLYYELKRQLWAKDAAELAQDAIALSDTVHELASEQSAENWRREWAENIARSRRLSARILTPDGEIYVAKTGFNIPSHAFPPTSLPYQANGEYVAAGKHSLLAALPVEVTPGRIWRIEVALDLTQSNQVLHTYREKLTWLLLIALSVTSCLGWFIASRSLLPLARISKTMHLISAQRLSTRIGGWPWPSELKELADSFDAMLDRLEASFVQLNRFSSDMAHEVRTPLNNLSAAASVTLARTREPADYQNTLETVVVECEHLARVVETMLFLARADNAAEVVHLEPVSAADELRRQAEFFESKAAEAQVSLHCKGDATLRADPILLRRALSNLIDNAIRHTPAGGAITLTAGTTEQEVQFIVQDNGSGIADKHLPYLFERFYRVEPARTERDRNGLGLAIVRSIAILHGGQVGVLSQLGQGTTFTLILPK